MKEWARKRFWTQATAAEQDDRYTVQLDGRTVRTPAKAPLILPTRALAEAVAAEWDAQSGIIDPAAMPLTRAANAALDRVAHAHDDVVAMLADYAESDLLCHRAETPHELRAAQDAAWDPLLRWAATDLNVSLQVTTGIMPVSQPVSATRALRDRVAACEAFELTALHDLVIMSGSLIIGLAVLEDHARAEQLWPLSRIEEDWQAKQWGTDPEASARAEDRRSAFVQAERFLHLLRDTAAGRRQP